MEPRQVITPAQEDIRLSSEPQFGREPMSKKAKAISLLIVVSAATGLFIGSGSPVQAENPEGGWVPTPTRTKTPTPRPTNTPTPKPTNTALPTATRENTPTPRPTNTALPTATRENTPTPRPTSTPLPTATRENTSTPKPTVTPVATIIATIDSTPTLVATKTKVPPTVTPISTREIKPTPTKKKATATPTKRKPTAVPTKRPTARPTLKPTSTKELIAKPTSTRTLVLGVTGGDLTYFEDQNLYNAPERFITEVDDSSDNWVVEDYSDEEEILESVEFLPEENVTAETNPNDAITLLKIAVAAAAAGSGLLLASKKRRNR